MPNWCQNQITLTGPKAVIEEIAATNLSLEAIVPCPEDLKGFEKCTPVPKDEKKQRAALLKKYGVDTEFDWHVVKWGTKWDINLDTIDTDVSREPCLLYASFDSAWSPPVEAMRVLYEKYKDTGLTLHLEYFEPGCRFLGISTGNHGDFEDDCREYTNADELEAHVKELEHNLAESEVEWLREQEAEEKAEAEAEDKPTFPEAPVAKKKAAAKKAAAKKAAPKKAAAKKAAPKKAAKK